MKKFLVAAIFGLAGLAAFAGTCVITHMSIVSTDNSHMTIGGQVDNNSGANILQHNILVAFLDSGMNLVETQSVPGCLNSVPNGQSDFFSATSTHAASSITSSIGLARIAFDSTFRIGTTSSQNVSISNITANRNNTATPATLTVTGKVTNNSGTLYSPGVCTVVRTSAGNVLIAGRTSLSQMSSSSSQTFTDTFTVPNDSTASTVDIWVDGHDSSGVPTTPQSQTGTSVTIGGIANKLSFSVQPVGNVVINTNINTSPTVSILDSSNNVATGSTLVVTLSVLASSGPAGETVTCDDNTVTAVSGIAAFTNCKLNHADPNIQLTATASGVTSVNSNTFAINPGTATSLSFTTQPVGSTGGLPFATQPVVTVLDGNLDVFWTGTDSTSVITLSIGTNAGPGGVLTCLPVAAIQGVATFASCSIDKIGTGYTLLANGGTAPVLPASAASAVFNVTLGAAAKLIITTAPTTPMANSTPFTAQPVVTVEDAGGNTVTSSTASITLTMTILTGTGVLTCTTAIPAPAVSGVLTYVGCAVSLAGTYTFSATSSGLTAAPATGTITIT